MSDDTQCFTCTVVGETEKAWLVDHNNVRTWLPRSQILTCQSAEPPGQNAIQHARVTLTIPTWLYDQKFETCV